MATAVAISKFFLIHLKNETKLNLQKLKNDYWNTFSTKVFLYQEIDRMLHPISLNAGLVTNQDNMTQCF